MSNPKTIGTKLKNLRTKANETVKEIADAIEVSESAWRMYELGQRIPRDEIKERIANHYNTSIEFLFFTG
jgi:transcriptional regulator with XRE-family HTH domain